MYLGKWVSILGWKQTNSNVIENKQGRDGYSKAKASL